MKFHPEAIRNFNKPKYSEYKIFVLQRDEHKIFCIQVDRVLQELASDGCENHIKQRLFFAMPFKVHSLCPKWHFVPFSYKSRTRQLLSNCCLGTLELLQAEHSFRSFQLKLGPTLWFISSFLLIKFVHFFTIFLNPSLKLISLSLQLFHPFSQWSRIKFLNWTRQLPRHTQKTFATTHIFVHKRKTWACV